MAMGLGVAAIIAVAGTLQVFSHPFGSSATECQSSADCGPGECCVLGMMRYSMPQCLPHGQIEDYCREDNVAENRTLFYPSGVAVDNVDVYTHVCPCDTGLQCTDNSCQPVDNYDNNYIY
uniref:U52-Liphistoxin-Lth1a_1 n=2 Tax=Liphistius TaxID=62150 RepID=A0A4Q8K105_9ARAC